MKLRYITCSDPREHNSVKSILELARLPHSEIAVQCHPSKMENGMPRNVWFNELLRVAIQVPRGVFLAIHINNEWSNTICTKGDITDIIQQQTNASEQILIALKQISAGVENFTVATDNISSSSEHIRQMSEEMNNSVKSAEEEKKGIKA